MFSYRARRTIFGKKSLFTTVKLISFSFCPADKVPVGLFVLEKIYLTVTLICVSVLRAAFSLYCRVTS